MPFTHTLNGNLTKPENPLKTFLPILDYTHSPMTNSTPVQNSRFARLPLDFGWIQVLLAALAMVATLPGRTHGVGLVTEKLLADLGMTHIAFADLNFWATLIGALFAVGIGKVIDRVGSRIVLTVLTVLLGVVVVLTAGSGNTPLFALLFVLTRGLGQSALSVASLALVGKWFVRRINKAMAIYSIVLSIGFMMAFPVVGSVVEKSGWRVAWSGIGWALLMFAAPLFALFVRRSPESVGLPPDGTLTEEPSAERGVTLWQALRSPAFWVIGLASALYGLISSGIALSNEAILVERGFNAAVYRNSLAVTAIVSLVGNFWGGWLTQNRSVVTQHRLMGVAMLILMVALAWLTQVSQLWQIMTIAVLMGLAGGFVIVIFFAYWARAYGRKHLGQIQGVAQALTVLASALGPVLLERGKAASGSYAGGFWMLAAVVGVFGIASALTPAPRSNEMEEEI
jgi:MFS family permease